MNTKHIDAEKAAKNHAIIENGEELAVDGATAAHLVAFGLIYDQQDPPGAQHYHIVDGYSWPEVDVAVATVQVQSERATRFDRQLASVMEGLEEYYPGMLGRRDQIRGLVQPTYRTTGNDQSDYELLREVVEKAYKEMAKRQDLARIRVETAADRAVQCHQSGDNEEAMTSAVYAGRFGQPAPESIAGIAVLASWFKRGESLAQFDPVTLDIVRVPPQSDVPNEVKAAFTHIKSLYPEVTHAGLVRQGRFLALLGLIAGLADLLEGSESRSSGRRFAVGRCASRHIRVRRAGKSGRRRAC
ncbi:hypothetical protein [Paraburkholderia sp. SIMBA_054]|uniref:hypothetical protein n=1 Tax=Paraburkholderia sp. SIMBA_054 TaxID=3085795 RepID=UPI003979C6FE